MDNDGPQNHDVTILRMLPGKTDAEIDKWPLKLDMRDAPVEAVGGPVATARRGHSEFAADLKPGNYFIVCLVLDEKDGKPHFMHGMSTKVTVS